jgi:hypothetical protein
LNAKLRLLELQVDLAHRRGNQNQVIEYLKARVKVLEKIYRRIKALFEAGQRSRTELDEAEADILDAEARLSRAKEAATTQPAARTQAQSEVNIKSNIVPEGVMRLTDVRPHDDGSIIRWTLHPAKQGHLQISHFTLDHKKGIFHWEGDEMRQLIAPDKVDTLSLTQQIAMRDSYVLYYFNLTESNKVWPVSPSARGRRGVNLESQRDPTLSVNHQIDSLRRDYQILWVVQVADAGEPIVSHFAAARHVQNQTDVESSKPTPADRRMLKQKLTEQLTRQEATSTQPPAQTQPTTQEAERPEANENSARELPSYDQLQQAVEDAYARRAKLLRRSRGSARFKWSQKRDARHAKLKWEADWYQRGPLRRFDIRIPKMDNPEQQVTSPKHIRHIMDEKTEFYYEIDNERAFADTSFTQGYGNLLGYASNFQIQHLYQLYDKSVAKGLDIYEDADLERTLSWDELNGLRCIKLEVTEDEGRGPDRHATLRITRLWFCPEQAYSLIKAESLRHDIEDGACVATRKSMSYEATYKQSRQHADVWLLSKVAMMQQPGGGPGGEGGPEHLRGEITNQAVGIEVPREQFTVGGLDVPAGTPVYELRGGQREHEAIKEAPAYTVDPDKQIKLDYGLEALRLELKGHNQ